MHKEPDIFWILTWVFGFAAFFRFVVVPGLTRLRLRSYAGMQKAFEVAGGMMPGQKMQDGTVFAGISPLTRRPMFTTPNDAPQPLSWSDANAYVQGLCMQSGYPDWRIPISRELDVLYMHREAIGGFNLEGNMITGWYWGDYRRWKTLTYTSWAMRFSDGIMSTQQKYFKCQLRCVRG